MPQGLSNAASAAVEALKINSITEKLRKGRPVVLKRRNVHGEQMADLANFYFRTWNIPIRFLSKVKVWRRWEIKCFNMLNGDRFCAVASGERPVIEDKLPGESLWDHMNRGTLTGRMLTPAAKEFHRTHHFWSDEFRGRWSHGDATTTNVIYFDAFIRYNVVRTLTYEKYTTVLCQPFSQRRRRRHRWHRGV